jgi:putative transcriptional regulator
MTGKSKAFKGELAGTQGLAGQMLIAMPAMEDPRFQRSVIYMCAHSEKGAMGIVINKRMPTLTFAELLEQLGIETSEKTRSLPIHFGGPVDTGRGFVLHSLDYGVPEATMEVAGTIGLTATVDILKSIARGQGPDQALLALGYAGWDAGQLEDEIRANGWLTCEASLPLLFNTDIELTWQRAIGTLGIDPAQLSNISGNA